MSLLRCPDRRLWPVVFLLCLGQSGCSGDPVGGDAGEPVDVSRVPSAEHTYAVEIPVGLIEPDLPLDRPLTEEKVELGRRLFFDTDLSASRTTSCATCHHPASAFADPRGVSLRDDGRVMDRNSPSLLNAGYLVNVGWDGRFGSLEQQARDPFRVDGDMGIPLEEAIARIEAEPGYMQAFESAFGGPPTVAGMAEALAAYQRTLVSGGSRFDRYLFERREEALTRLEKEGLEVFLVQGGCINCHDVFHPYINPLGGGTALFTDHRFHNLGVGYSDGRMSDVGRYAVTRDPDDWGAFRTPSLRNVALTPPYMHDGSLETLEEVVDFYNRGGTPNPNLSPTLRPLLLSEKEKRALEAFLESLTSCAAQQVCSPR